MSDDPLVIDGQYHHAFSLDGQGWQVWAFETDEYKDFCFSRSDAEARVRELDEKRRREIKEERLQRIAEESQQDLFDA